MTTTALVTAIATATDLIGVLMFLTTESHTYSHEVHGQCDGDDGTVKGCPFMSLRKE